MEHQKGTFFVMLQTNEKGRLKLVIICTNVCLYICIYRNESGGGVIHSFSALHPFTKVNTSLHAKEFSLKKAKLHESSPWLP